ncbi:hypothetical protein [Parapedobacter indicus]|uniref:Uncharacterized protein n=1 Tax=Parapedobacter indicus TaxID=1477437 RepID=A0A1I3SQX8_9SPHI|nr:hypothetical protein [Parapedobacter indicus]PPK99748.1 hypothetical protein CLV26_11181 [Parapedobacter indicus]SFJ60189.1 hypothetical protein SAMN05444682_111118 [Parapedobacter indicus]
MIQISRVYNFPSFKDSEINTITLFVKDSEKEQKIKRNVLASGSKKCGYDKLVIVFGGDATFVASSVHLCCGLSATSVGQGRDKGRLIVG